MSLAARIGDLHTCPMTTGTVPHVGGAILSGWAEVLVGGMCAARSGDEALCTGDVDTIAEGCATVLIGGMPAARFGDLTSHGGVITEGCATVLIG